MQNSKVLDLLTAPQGGVCAMVGQYFCTYIPENDEDGPLIDQASLNLTALQSTMISDLHPRSDWFSSWKPLSNRTDTSCVDDHGLLCSPSHSRLH